MGRLKELKTGSALRGIFLRFQVKKNWGVKKVVHEGGLDFMQSNSANYPGNMKKREQGIPVDNTRKNGVL